MLPCDFCSATRAAHLLEHVIADRGNPDACWTYTGPADPDDHARAIYEVLRGPLLDAGLDPHCGNPRCVRPGLNHRARDDQRRDAGRGRPQ